MGAELYVWNCPACGNPYKMPKGQAPPDTCPECAKRHTIKRRVTREEAYAKVGDVAERTEAEIDAYASKVKLTTSHRFSGVEIDEELGIVAVEAVAGVGAWNDLWASLTDTTGGRSKRLEGAMKKLRETALTDLRREAVRIKAHGVIGLRLNYSEIGTGKGHCLMLLVASGTAVTVYNSDDEP